MKTVVHKIPLHASALPRQRRHVDIFDWRGRGAERGRALSVAESPRRVSARFFCRPPTGNMEERIIFPELIRRKRDSEKLTAQEIKCFVRAAVDGTIQEAQIGAMLMAIWMKGMDAEETSILTREMTMSGEVLSWPEEWKGLVVDKHSTGGVGDKVTLPLAPALAACGCKVPKISGRGLAHTGGTLDKLESIPGFSVQQTAEQMEQILKEAGCCIVSQTQCLAPADKVLYGLRDVTSTVDSLPLITGSIISKKGAESLSALILDVKFGKAALCKDINSAKNLAHSLVTTGSSLGIRTGAMLSRMDKPIGCFVGNSLEVMEALECLKGRGPSDLQELVLSLGACLLKMCGKASTLAEGKQKISDTLTGGAALGVFQTMLQVQGVSRDLALALCSPRATIADYYPLLGQAECRTELPVQKEGTVLEINGLVLATILHNLGAGRTKAGEPIDHLVGAELLVKLGQKVKKGEPWVRVHHRKGSFSMEYKNSLQEALVVGTADCFCEAPLVAEFLPSELSG
ncbi:thymidine phosphorylase isoform X1 [Arapaima gigas]